MEVAEVSAGMLKCAAQARSRVRLGSCTQDSAAGAYPPPCVPRALARLQDLLLIVTVLHLCSPAPR